MGIDDYNESNGLSINSNQGMVSSNTDFNKRTATESYISVIPSSTGSGIDNLRLSISGQELNRRVNVKDALLVDTIPEMDDLLTSYNESVYEEDSSHTRRLLYYITQTNVDVDTIPKISTVLNKYREMIYSTK